MSLDEQIDLYNWLEDRFLRYIGSADSLFGEEIDDLLRRTSKELEVLTAERERLARIDELEAVDKAGKDHFHRDEVRTHYIIDRIAELEKEQV